MNKKNKVTFTQTDLFENGQVVKDKNDEPLILKLVAKRGSQVEQFVSLLKCMGLARAYQLCKAHNIYGVRGEKRYLVDTVCGSRKDYYKHVRENGKDYYIYTNMALVTKWEYLDRLYDAMMDEYRLVD